MHILGFLITMYKSLGLIILAVVACFHAVPIKEVNEHIVGGTESRHCEFPHMVYLDISMGNAGTFCGATLISRKHILTAAHCIEKDVTGITAHFGSTNKNNATVQIRVRQWVLHRDYVKRHTIDNDIAVLELVSPVPNNRCIQPIGVPNKGDTFKTRCVTAGWGQTAENGHYPDQMRRTNIDIIPNDKCQNYSPGATVEQHICAGDLKRNGQNICNGDSGGGLICRRTSDNKYVVAGVSSYGFDCDEGFGVFTNTANYRDFIDDYTT
ncbi:plasma kallikrein [Octopus bimaculoides]|uniref:Peptidase S1 domain-containing protein n=1 Tax=Octopus bimaculoides TaxID=37653 RepID=A0A0L8HU11_OCTBM|nr:plasma kallikrein [Octopus bimaculoides]|eukprot:XP_014769410.1 PREDICTED: plasma kallikrein-like [Octopus bimaculoides]